VAHSVGGGVLDISLADISLHADRPTRALILTAMRHDFDKEDDRPAKESSAEQNAADFREHRAAILGTRDHSGPYALTGLVFTTVAAGLVAYHPPQLRPRRIGHHPNGMVHATMSWLAEPAVVPAAEDRRSSTPSGTRTATKSNGPSAG
jgi:hypothetical protein